MRCRFGLTRFTGGIGIASIGYDPQPAKTGDDLAKKLKPLAGCLGRLVGEPGYVAAWSREARDRVGTDRIAHYLENDGDDGCSLLGGGNCRPSPCHNDIDLAPHELGNELSGALIASLRPAIFDCNIAAVDPAEFAQSLYKSREALRRYSRRGHAEVTNGRQLLRRLRPRGEWPRRRRAAEKPDELAPPHSITSSARASRDAGTSRPSTFRS